MNTIHGATNGADNAHHSSDKPDPALHQDQPSAVLSKTDVTKTDITVHRAEEAHYRYAERICQQIEESAKARGTGIAKRSPEYIREKMREGKAVIALTNEGEFAGFCYIEAWGDKQYVANSGLIVVPKFREGGLAKRIKHAAFLLSRERFPKAKIFSITTSHAVMKMNTELGYVPVPFSELTQDDTFWQGCSSCPNYDILTRTNRKMCLCTGMLYDPDKPKEVIQIDVPNTQTLQSSVPQESDLPAIPPEHTTYASKVSTPE